MEGKTLDSSCVETISAPAKSIHLTNWPVAIQQEWKCF
jgi:hypothetical protein